jgi:ferredoxin
MRIMLNRKRCDAHGMCFVVEQDLFPLDVDGYSAIGPDGIEVPPGREQYAQKGVDACPALALSIAEDA